VLLAVLGLTATCPTLVGRASACSCETLNPDQELTRGGAIGIVTRVDAGPGTEARFRVEKSFGADLPETLRGQTDAGMDCHVQVFPQEVAALIFRRDGGWVLPSCAELDVGDVLTRFVGGPSTFPSERPVAVAVGRFGAGGLVTLDRYGRPVAWSTRAAFVEASVLCPGGRTAVTVDQGGPDTAGALAVYDVDGLRLRRAVPLHGDAARWPEHLHCDDERGDTVGFRAVEGTETASVTVRGADVTTAPAGPPDSGADEAAGGYLALRGQRILRVPEPDYATSYEPDPDQIIQTVAAPEGHLVLAVTAGTGGGSGGGGQQVLVYDAGTGEVQARWRADDNVAELLWAGAGRPVVRTGERGGYGSPYRAGEIVWFDDVLRERARHPGVPGSGRASVGESIAFAGGTRLSIATPAGTRTLDDLWLTGTQNLLALPGATFTADAPPRSSVEPRLAPTLPSPPDGDLGPVAMPGVGRPSTTGPAVRVGAAAVALGAAALAGGAIRGRRNRAR
jgi:hypothetical protein